MWYVDIGLTFVSRYNANYEQVLIQFEKHIVHIASLENNIQHTKVYFILFKYNINMFETADTYDVRRNTNLSVLCEINGILILNI